MKVSHLLSCLAAGLALAACRDEGPTFVETAPQAYVRFVNASPDSPLVTARFIDRVENMFTWDRVGFRGNSGNYVAVNAGARHLRVFLAGQSGNATTVDSASTVLLDTTGITLQPQTYYTVLMTGRVTPRRGTAPNNASVVVFTDTLPAASSIAANQILVRAYHAIDAIGPVSVTIQSNVAGAVPAATIPSVAFRNRSAYVPLPVLTGTELYTFTAQPAAGAAVVFTPNVPGQAFTPASLAGGSALDPVAGVRQGRSVLSAVVFPAVIRGTPAEPAPLPANPSAAQVATYNAFFVPFIDLLPDQAPPRP